IFNKLDEADWCNHILIHTGQHYDELLSGVFFDDLQIRRPDFNLQIGGSGKKHYQQQAELGTKTIELFEKENINLFVKKAIRLVILKQECVAMMSEC
ncbi:MAG: UDP-N-acetylglucosamine 2-epimerase, partial [Candidatus Hodarchaeales archaeon]